MKSVKTKYHALGGIVSFFIFLSFLKFIGITLSYELLVFSLFSSLFGALIPDIDLKRSRIHRYFLYTSIFLLLAIFINSTKSFEVAACILFLALLILFHKRVKHRKFFHSLKFGIICSLLLGAFSALLLNSFLPAFFFFLGFFSHLILDRKV